VIPAVLEAKRRRYRVEGHIAVKTHGMERDVSVTFGLPFLSTSVDHGTAFDIAGTGMASAVSMVVAVSPTLPQKRAEIIVDSAESSGTMKTMGT
jgi:hypothetical protein